MMNNKALISAERAAAKARAAKAKAAALLHYENVTLRQVYEAVDAPETPTEGSIMLGADTPPKKKLGSSRRAQWLKRRRSRSLDSSYALCDYTSLRRSSTLKATNETIDLSTEQTSSTSQSFDDTTDYGKESHRSKQALRRLHGSSIYEEALPVDVIRGVSIRTDRKKDQNKTSLTRKCSSMNDIDHENVQLQNPSSRINYENVRLSNSSVDYQDNNIYEDPWNTLDTLQMLLKRQSLAVTEETIEGQFLPLLADSHRGSMDITVATASSAPSFLVDAKLPLLQQRWYHDELSRCEAEQLLNSVPVGAFLVRVNSLRRKDLTLSVKTMSGVVHMIAVRQKDCRYILGQFSEPFESAAALIEYYSQHPLKINGAPHTILTYPVNCTF